MMLSGVICTNLSNIDAKDSKAYPTLFPRNI